MNNTMLGRIILFGTVVLACLMIVQIYWFSKAFNVAEKEFDHSVQVALKKVADSVSHEAEVKKISANLFTVSTSAGLDGEHVDSLLQHQFMLRALDVDYELGVYNATEDTLLYGSYIEASGKKWVDRGLQSNPKDEAKNFAVYFPRKTGFIVSQLNIWIFSTLVLLLMTGFFAYAIASLLRERKFSSLKNDFINNMTHEFKTPVTNINIAAEVLQKRLTNDPASKVYLDLLLRENKKLHNKIDQVLLGSSVDYTSQPHFQPVDMHEMIRSCVENFDLKLKQRNGEIQFDFQANQTCILGDSELLSQALSNVIDNAEKYTPSKPKIVLRTKDREKEIEVEIADNGIGIPSQMKNKVFQKFFRVRTGDVHNVKGFGLGLSFVKSVVEKHYGKISLQSELNQGTVVRILLPRA